jgi:chemotaxis response regulator CheB
MVTRLLVVDDSRILRCRIAEILEADARIAVVGTAANAGEARDGDVIRSGRLWIAPRGRQMTFAQQGATVWSQDKASSVIYGMPMAVAEAGLSEQVLSLHDIGPALVQAAGG